MSHHASMPHLLDIWIPGGWLNAGDDPEALNALPAQRWWIEDFWICRDPVTFREYCAFLDALPPDEAALRAPTLRPWLDAEVAPTPRWTLSGAVPENAPVVGVSWWDATAYAAWRAAQDALPWRLPTELEWERAARGPSHHLYPWGDAFDPTRCRMVASSPPPGLVSVDACPDDISHWGVRGLGGNAADWCLDAYRYEGSDTPKPNAPIQTPTDPDAFRVYRGGAWLYTADLCRAARRGLNAPTYRGAHLGFRLVRSPSPHP